MGGICSICGRNSPVDKSPSDTTLGTNVIVDTDLTNNNHLKLSSEDATKQLQEELVSSSDRFMPTSLSTPYDITVSDELPRLSRSFSQNSTLSGRKITTTKAGTKVPDISSILGRARTAGLGKAVEVLDTLGSSMTNLNLSGSGFVPGGTTKGNKVTILAFEVANTIVKGSNLMRSLSKESIKHLKEVVLASEGVQLLISKDMDELLRLAAADKREEFQVFSNEVVRFGNRCKDPQWHNLDRYFEKLASEITPQFQFKIEAESVMQQLMAWAQCTAELYHDLHALDRFELDYRRMSKEENNQNETQRGEHLQIIKHEVKSQKKLVKSLKKKSLWAKNLEEVMEKLVDIVHFLHLEIRNAFGNADLEGTGDAPIGRGVKLGPAGLALHYANIITQIDALVSRSGSIPASTRDALYQGLPPSVKSSLRSRLHAFQVKEELSVSQIKAEMEKTMRWLGPIAGNTTKAHHGFGWVGEWANTGSEVSSKPSGQADLTLIETLHHADKSKTESCILDLIVWLHLLISQSKPPNGVTFKSPVKSPIRSPTQKEATTAPSDKPSTSNSASCVTPSLSQEDQEMLQRVKYRKFMPGLSRSQELDTGKGKNKRLCKSHSHSPTGSTSSNKRDFFSTRRPPVLPVIDFHINKIKTMDMIDGVDDLNIL